MVCGYDVAENRHVSGSKVPHRSKYTLQPTCLLPNTGPFHIPFTGAQGDRSDLFLDVCQFVGDLIVSGHGVKIAYLGQKHPPLTEIHTPPCWCIL